MSHSLKARHTTGLTLAAALTMLMLVGCPAGAPRVSDSVSIIDLDKELVALYGEKLAAPPNAQAEANGKLANLATRAAKQGDKTRASSDFPSTVSFYRIAATADWAAGTPHNKNVPDLSDRGADACGRLANPEVSQRSRDCALLKMAPNLALLDAKAGEAEALRKAGPQIPAASFEKAVVLSEDVSGQMQAVLTALSAASPLAESFEQYLRSDLNGNYCMLAGLVGRLDASSPPDALMNRAKKSLQAAQASMLAAGVPVTCQF